jgi:hypothetical protein
VLGGGPPAAMQTSPNAHGLKRIEAPARTEASVREPAA